MSNKVLFALAVVLSCFVFLACNSIPKYSDPVAEMQRLLDNGKIQEARDLFSEKNDINERSKEKPYNTVLHIAAITNNESLAQYLISRGANPNIRNDNGDTPLHLALKNNAKETAAIICQANPKIFTPDANGKNAIDLAVNNGSKYYDAIFTKQTGEIRDGKNRTFIHYLVETENEDALNYCIKQGIPLSYRDSEGMTPLKMAYKKNSEKGIEIASLLLMAGAEPERSEYSYFEDCQKVHNVSLRFDDGQTPLHFASIFGHTAIANHLLKNGANPKVKDTLGSTPLHEAVRYGHTDIALLLLKKGADPNSQDSLGKTPLFLVIGNKKPVETTSTLLSNGANPNAKDMFGDTPLHLATMTNMPKELIATLVKGGADINERNKKGITPMAVAVSNMNSELVKYYADSNADIHAEDNKGNSPLSILLENSDKSSLELLKNVVNSSNINSRDSNGNTPLHIAINKNADVSHVSYLISLCGDINIRNRNGDTPLYLAVQKNRKPQGELLLKNGGDVFATNNENYSPLRIALTSGGDAQEWILTSDTIKKTDGTGNTPLHYAAEWKLDNAVDVLLAKGADPNAKNANGETPVFNAIKSDSTSTIDLLLKSKAKKNERDFLGNTPLHCCVRWDAKNSAMKLIQWKADPNVKNLAGKTPLAQAARSGRIAMATLLLENGANINETDATGKTVLIDAVQSNNAEMVAMLLKNGASPQVQEMYGRNAYHEAVLTGNMEIIKMVGSYGGNPLARDATGVTPFSLVINQKPEVIKTVLGNNKNLIDSDSNSPLHIAIEGNASDEVIGTLISMGYPVNARNRNGLTALSIAVNKGKISQIKALLQSGADPFIESGTNDSPVISSIKACENSSANYTMIDTFIDYTKVKKDYQGEGFLHYCAKYANAETIKHVLGKGLEEEKGLRNVSGETAAEIAERWNRSPEITNLLK